MRFSISPNEEKLHECMVHGELKAQSSKCESQSNAKHAPSEIGGTQGSRRYKCVNEPEAKACMLYLQRLQAKEASMLGEQDIARFSSMPRNHMLTPK